MKEIKCKVDELLEIVRKNRGEHRETFEKALAGYRREAIKRLDEMLGNAKAGRQFEQYIGLQAPTDQTDDYDRVIRMLELSVDKEIMLSESEISCYVLDRWNWKQNWDTVTKSYGA